MQSEDSVLLIAGEPDSNANLRLIAYKGEEKKWIVTEVNWVELGDQSLGLIQLSSIEGSVDTEPRHISSKIAQSQRLLAAYSAAKQMRFDRTDHNHPSVETNKSKVCENCGAAFVAENPYHRYCYSCYRTMMDKSHNGAADRLQNNSTASVETGKVRTETENRPPTTIRRGTIIGIIAAVIIVVLGIVFASQLIRNDGDEINPAVVTTPSFTPNSFQQQDSRAGGVVLDGEPCGCSENLYNCGDFDSRAEAQACFEYCFPNSGDIHYLDSDGDKRVCETSP